MSRSSRVVNLRNLNVTGTFQVGGVAQSATPTEVNKLAGVTAGTVLASKAVVVGASKEVNEWTVTAGALTQSQTVSTAALGTVRGVHGQVTASNAAIASGNVVGVRGLCTLSGTVSAGGAYFYGAQGKLIVTGTMNHADSRLCAGLSQLDATGGTLTTGQLSGHWIDVVGVTGAGGDQFNLLRMTAGSAAKPNALIYAQSNATNLLDVGHPTGTTTDYFLTAGTASGSAGDTTKANASKVFVVSVDGTPYYIPLFASNGS